MAVNSEQHHYCLFTFYLPPLFICVDFDWWRHFKKGGEEGGGGEEYFNCLVSNSYKSTVHTARVPLQRNVNPHILVRSFPFYQALFFLKEVGCSASMTYLIITGVAHHTSISQENQCCFFNEEVLRLLQNLFCIFTSYATANSVLELDWYVKNCSDHRVGPKKSR